MDARPPQQHTASTSVQVGGEGERGGWSDEGGKEDGQVGGRGGKSKEEWWWKMSYNSNEASIRPTMSTTMTITYQLLQ